MTGQRISRGGSPKSLHGGLRADLGETDELITSLRSGDTSDFFDEEDEIEDKQEEEFTPAGNLQPTVSSPAVPSVITRVLASDTKDELLGVAHFLDPKNTKHLTLVFHTPIGDVKSQVKWTDKLPSDLSKHERLMLIQVKSSEVMFSPTPGAELEISFVGCHGRLKVTCLAPPQNLYPGIDLFCFLPHNDSMEKQGVLKEDAPSVVSGKPGDTVDQGGEPIVEGEKSAAVLENVTFADSEKEDFDKARA